MMQHYAPPSENNTENYISFIEKQTGLSGDTVVGELTAAPARFIGLSDQHHGRRARRNELRSH